MKKSIKIPKHGGDVYSEGLLKNRELIDYSSNINPLGVPESFTNHINEALNSVIRYPDINYRRLKDSIIEYLSGGIGITRDNLVLGNGAAEIIDIAISLLDSILIVTPSFVEYEDVAEKWECNIKYSYLNEDMEYDYEDMLSKIQYLDGIIMANPNNPNGSIIDIEKFLPILEYCDKENKIVILDEAFVEFIGNKEASLLKLLDRYKCLFIIRALTKFFALPGIRFGYGISKNLQLINKIKEKQMPWNVNCFAEIAAVYVLRDEKYIKDSLRWIKEERVDFIEKLRNIGFIERVYNTHGNYVLCKLKPVIDDEKLYELCLEKDILIRRCSNYRGLDRGFVRFAIKDRKTNSAFLEALKAIEYNLR